MQEIEITLSDVLAARERRVQTQSALLRQYRVPLCCFTMNIAGPLKLTPLILRAFDYGCQSLRTALAKENVPIVFEKREIAPAGCEYYLAANTDALHLKGICTAIEDETPLGRLFDMDVLGTDGEKLDRARLGGKERGCIVCGAPGRGCASRRVHSVEELQDVTWIIMEDFFAQQDGEAVCAAVTRALTDEVYTTPKPGLVDAHNSGSHRDMDLQTFENSIAALTPYWKKCFDIGNWCADVPFLKEETFSRLRKAGLEAENAMFAATGGVNTHKGAIFTLGVLCGAVGRLWNAEKPRPGVQQICAECAAMTKQSMDEDFAAMDALSEAELTAGGRIYRRYGLRGIRGEVADGLLSVQNVSLPAFEAALKAGKSRNDAGAIALLHLIALGNDTNMIARGGMEAAAQAAGQVKAMLAQNPMPSMEEIAALDTEFIRQNLSPGGCADLLAVTYFLYEFKRSTQ